MLGYLPDDDLVEFLKRAGQSVREVGGVIMVKENVLLEGFKLDRDDNNIIRSVEMFRQVFKLAGLEVIEELRQENWPEYLVPMYLWVLK